MSRTDTINISLSPQELKWVKKGIASGRYASAKQVVHEGLRQLFNAGKTRLPAVKARKSSLAEGYRKMAALDRVTAVEWSKLDEAWPAD